MGMLAEWLQKSRQLKSQVTVLHRGLGDPRVPWLVKLLTLLVIAYVLSPIDIIPDFIPVLGLLDEVILVPVALAFIMRLIPEEVIRDYQSTPDRKNNNHIKILGAVLVISLWIVLIVVCYQLWKSF